MDGIGEGPRRGVTQAAPQAAAVAWRHRVVHDLMFQLDGSGWYGPELHDGIGFRWSGPGRIAVLRMPLPLPPEGCGGGGGGLGEVHVVSIGRGNVASDLDIYLNGHRLACRARQEGAVTVVRFAYAAAMVAGADTAEFWFVTGEPLVERPGAGAAEGRRLGVAVSCIVLEPDAAATAPAAADDAPVVPATAATVLDGAESLAFLLGRRLLDRELAVEAASCTIQPDAAGEAQVVTATGLRLAGAALPSLRWRLCRPADGGGGVVLELRAAENPGLDLRFCGAALRRDPAADDLVLRVAAPPGEALDGLAALAPFDRVALALLLRDSGTLFDRWMEGRGIEQAGAAAILAEWRVALRAARADATRSLATLAMTEPDFLGLLVRGPATGSLFARHPAAAPEAAPPRPTVE